MSDRLTFSVNPSRETRPHAALASECWCGPIFLRPCEECGGMDAGCWRCDQGGIALDDYERETYTGSVLIVRHRMAGGNC